MYARNNYYKTNAEYNEYYSCKKTNKKR